nr:hypothetical protein CJLB15_00003 [Campylobacter phage CJLB-15]
MLSPEQLNYLKTFQQSGTFDLWVIYRIIEQLNISLLKPTVSNNKARKYI